MSFVLLVVAWPSIATETVMGGDISLWESGVESEVGWWDEWLKERGGNWPQDYQARMNGSTEFKYATLLSGRQHYRVLDVGSGPLSVLGYRLDNAELELVLTDPLADEYAELFRKHKLQPPVIPRRVMAEESLATFGEDYFDLVVSQNALDHSVNPVDAVLQAVHVLRPNGTFVLIVHPLERGSRETPIGLHRWNFANVNGSLWVHEPASRKLGTQESLFNVARLVAPYADMHCEGAPCGSSVLDGITNGCCALRATTGSPPCLKSRNIGKERITCIARKRGRERGVSTGARMVRQKRTATG